MEVRSFGKCRTELLQATHTHIQTHSHIRGGEELSAMMGAEVEGGTSLVKYREGGAV